MSKIYRTFICGGDETPGPRETDCPNALHDHPLPSGYVDASEVAARRLRQHWRNVRCRDCGFYGWVTPTFTAAVVGDAPVPALGVDPQKETQR